LLIAPSFLPVCPSCRYDADRFDIILFAVHRMRDEQHHVVLDGADRLPSVLAALNAVLLRECKRVCKDPRRRFERNTMTRSVERRLLAIPDETKRHPASVAANM
jgi:hypothetical protein